MGENTHCNGEIPTIRKLKPGFAINIENSDNYVLELKSKNKVVNLGDTSNLSTKMLWIQTFNKLEGSTKGEIMLNMNLNDDKNKPYFRRNIES